MRVGLTVFVVLEALVIAQAFFAHENGFLTVSQMHENGIAQGLPFLWHFGMWGDLLVVSPLVATIVARHWKQWPWRQIALQGCISIAATTFMTYIYSLSKVAESHKAFAVGAPHAVYMALALWALLIFYFGTESPNKNLIRIASVLLPVHMLFGTHLVLTAWAKLASMEWYPISASSVVIGIATLLILTVGLAWRATQLLATKNASPRPSQS